MKKILYIFLPLLLLTGCKAPGKTYTVAIDPSFYPLTISGKEQNVYIFSRDLLQAIAKKEGVTIREIEGSWDSLHSDLLAKKYDGALSSARPLAFTVGTYHFSDILLPTGPVLLVRKDAWVSSLTDISHGLVLVEDNDQLQRVQAKNPNLTLKTYTLPKEACEKLTKQQAEGVLLEAIVARSYVENLYRNTLRTVGKPMGDTGLRVLTPKDASSELTDLISRGLTKLKSDGSYDALVQKWSVL